MAEELAGDLADRIRHALTYARETVRALEQALRTEEELTETLGHMLAQPGPLTRDQLVARLAEVSHTTWMRQAERDKGQRGLEASVTEHDRERAEDVVRELERLGIFPSHREGG
jgi:hypothetical protein